MLLQQAEKYEVMLNACLLRRLAEERRFQDILQLEEVVISKSVQLFDQSFDRANI